MLLNATTDLHNNIRCIMEKFSSFLKRVLDSNQGRCIKVFKCVVVGSIAMQLLGLEILSLVGASDYYNT